MSETEMVVDASAALEDLLATRLGAQGNGLGEKVRSIDTRLPGEIADRLYYINRERNALMHPPRRPLTDPPRFAAAAAHCIQWLTDDPGATPQTVLAQSRELEAAGSAVTMQAMRWSVIDRLLYWFASGCAALTDMLNGHARRSDVPDCSLTESAAQALRSAWSSRSLAPLRPRSARAWTAVASIGLFFYALMWAVLFGGTRGMVLVIVGAGILWWLHARFPWWMFVLITAIGGTLAAPIIFAVLAAPT